MQWVQISIAAVILRKTGIEIDERFLDIKILRTINSHGFNFCTKTHCHGPVSRPEAGQNSPHDNAELVLVDYGPLLAPALRKFNFPSIISAIVGPIKLLKLCYFHLIIWYVKFSTCSKEILRLWLVLCEVTCRHPCHHRQSELIQVLKTCTSSAE